MSTEEQRLKQIIELQKSQIFNLTQAYNELIAILKIHKIPLPIQFQDLVPNEIKGFKNTR